MFRLVQERLDLKNEIDGGSSGKVYPYQEDPKDERWVVKRVKFERFEELSKLIQEIVIGFVWNHPCLVPVKGYSLDTMEGKNFVNIKLPRMKQSLMDEFVQRGGRRERKDEKKFCDEEQLIKYFYAIVCGLDHLHKKQIFHGDVKMGNILIDMKGNAKLSDFGCSRYIPEEDETSLFTSTNGALNYKAPEIIQLEKGDGRENGFNQESLSLADSWSLGLTMLEFSLLEIRLINPNKSGQEIQELLVELREKVEGMNKYGKALLDIIFGLLSFDVKNRLKVEDVKRRLETEFKEIIVCFSEGFVC